MSIESLDYDVNFHGYGFPGLPASFYIPLISLFVGTNAIHSFLLVYNITCKSARACSKLLIICV